MPDLIKRSLQIIGGGIKEVTKDYTENLVALKNDADIVKSGIMQAGRDANATIRQMKNNNNSLKRISDWFYQKENEYDSFDMNGADDDFDAGFSVDTADDTGSNTPGVRTLDADSMKDIAKGQMSAMYNIGSKQAEMSVANTAEIVSSLNSRSAEMIAAVNNVNTTLLSMSSKLDKLIELQGIGIETSVKQSKNQNVVGSDGKLSLSSVFDAVSSNAKDNLSFLSMFKDMSSGLTPEMAFGMALNWMFGDKKIKSLGNRSIDDIGTYFNDAIGAGIQTALSNIVESNKFKAIFGDLTKLAQRDRDYSRIQSERYTTKRATFDEMTRHSIIHVIPEYLKKINENLSGDRFEISESGALTTNPNYRNTFDRAINKAMSHGGSGISYKTSTLLMNQAKAIDSNMSTVDIDEAANALLRVYTVYLHKSGKGNLRQNQLTADDVSVINMAVTMLTRATGKPDSYWVPVCMTVLNHLSSDLVAGTEFCTNVNQRLQEVIKAGETWARTNNNPNLNAGKITYDSVANSYVEAYQDKHKSSKNTDNRTDATANIKKDDSSISGNHKYNMLDYARGIFGILNRGINVRVTNTVHTGDKIGDSYGDYEITRQQVTQPSGVTVSLDSLDSDLPNPEVTGNKGFLNTMLDKMVPKSFRISMQYFGKILNNAKDLSLGTTTNENGETEQQTVGGKLKQIMSPVTEKLKPVKEGLQDVGKSIIGEKTKGEDGKEHRTGGLVQRVGHKLQAGVNDAMDRIIEKQEFAKVKNEVNAMGSDDQDKIYAQQVLSLMQTSVADGETSEDMGGINEALGNIKDADLRSKLQKSVTAMLKRSEKAPEKSGIGKILTSVLGKAFSGVKSVFKKILGVGKKLFGIIGKVAKAVFAITKTGVSNVGRGLFGQKAKYDDDGNQVRPETEGLLKKPLNSLKNFAKKTLSTVTKLTKKVFSRITKLAKGITKLTKTAFKAVTTVTKGLLNLTKKGLSTIKGAVTKAGKNISEKLSKNKVFQSISKVFSNISKKVSGFFDKFKKNDKKKSLNDVVDSDAGRFVQGFKDSMNEAKEAAKAAMMNSPQNYGEKKTGEISEAVSGKNGIFKDIKEVIDKILQEVKTDNTQEAGGTTSSGGGGNISDPTEQEGGNENANTSGNTTTSGNTSGGGEETKPGGTTTSTNTDNKQQSGGEETKAQVSADTTGTTKKGGKLYSLGQTMGGLLSAAGMVGAIVQALSAVFPGFGDLVDTVKSIFTDALQPINELFKTLGEALMPVLSMVGEIITVVAEAVATIVECLIDNIEPILEVFQGLLGTVLDIISPILDIITAMIEIILAPLSGMIQYIIVPIVRHIGNMLQIQMGIVQVGIGIIISALGALLLGVGKVVDFFGGGDTVLNAGENMWDMGTGLVTSGIDGVKTGIQNEIQLVKDVFNGNLGNDDEEEEETETSTKEEKEPTGSYGIDGNLATNETNQSIFYSTNGSGNSTIYNYYGSGDMNQRSYGSYMNMSERGCGPVALADAYSRRTGVQVNPSQLASSMNSTGAYNTSRGTSVAGFIGTGNSMGMNMRAGGVTRQSLKQASPSNPITVLGSGAEFGTSNGNNHYMNVVGTDKFGAAYVSNPLTGRVERRSISGITNTSVMGLYGSGDTDYSLGIGDAFAESFSKLTDLSSNWLSAFTGKSTSDKMKDTIEATNTAEQEYQMKLSLGDDYEEYETKAFEAWKNDGNAKRDNETNEEHLERFRKSSKYQQYMNAASSDAIINSKSQIGNSINSLADSAYGTVDEDGNRSGGFGKSLSETLKTENTKYNSTSTSKDSLVTFISDQGVTLEGVNYTPQYTEPNITNSSKDGKSPLHEWFGKYANDDAYSVDENWFYNRNHPDKNGQGSGALTHKGIDINWTNDSSGTTPLYPTTSGKVVDSAASRTSDSMGNFVIWTDSAGIYHTYMHMKDKPFVDVNDEIIGGQTLLGYVGNTGYSSGPHLHYQITEKQSPSSPNYGTLYNPLTYFKYEQQNSPLISAAKQGLKAVVADGKRKVGTTDSLSNYSAWNSYKNKQGIDEFFDQAKKSNMSAAQAATIMSMGIWEDSAKKLLGEKSITKVTYDVNGQPAKGIMNWVDTSVDYGDTVQDQLDYVYKSYFSDNPTHSRGKVVNTGYNNNWTWGEPYEKVTGSKPTLEVGDKYGDFINSNLVEGSAQYFANALVPDGFNDDPAVVGKYVGTAVDIYNWMVDNGKAKVTELTGSGDPYTSQINTNMDIPPLDMSDYVSSYGNSEGIVPTTIVQRYEIRPDDSVKREQLKQILSNTYNVRAERVEELLEKILAKLDKTNSSSSSNMTSDNANTTQTLFGDDRIPSSVERLSIG